MLCNFHASNSSHMLQTHKDCVVHLSFETTFLLKHIILPHYCLARLCIGGKIALPMTVSKLPGPSVSPPSLFSESSLSKGVADGCRLQKGWGKIAKLGYSWPSVSTCGSRMVAFKLETHFDAHWPGEDEYRPACFFPNGLVEPKVLVSKECAEGCRM